ncbi:MAG: hypothetical protein K6F69_08820 [Treponema sp.]|nr:hypothetical protein [Treponema sp.]
MKNSLKTYIIFSFLMIFTLLKINAQTSDIYYTINLPEGFAFAQSEETEEGTYTLYEHKDLPVDLNILVTDNEKYESAKKALEYQMQTLINPKYAIHEIKWRNMNCAITDFSSKITSSTTEYTFDIKGWATAIPLINQKNILLVFCYAAEELNSKKEYDLDAITESIIDSIAIDNASYLSPGIITSYLFPNKGNKEINLEIEGKTIKTSIDENAKNAENHVIEREYKILEKYVQTAELKEAWQRYYNFIYRTDYAYFRNIAFSLEAELFTTEQEYAQKILYWVQTFKYERLKNIADFTALTEMLEGEGSDCDARSMLIAVILNHAFIPASLMVSSEYSHAMAVLNLPLEGFKFTVNGKNYLPGETTDKGLTWGKIAADMTDINKWLIINLPE